MNKKISVENLCLAVVIGLFLVAEFFCAKLAYETLGELVSGAYFLLMTLNMIPILLVFYGKRYIGMSLVIILGLFIIPYQVYLGNRLLLQKEEAANITVYLYEQKLTTGQFPPDLSAYKFKHSQLKPFFSYSKVGTGYDITGKTEYLLSYFTGTPSTSHLLPVGSNAGWSYYPD